MKKSYNDFKNKPLPECTKIDYHECLAKIILENIFADEFKNIKINDKPDLQSIDSNIGIEVTQAVNRKQKENENLYVKISYGLVKNKENAIKKINSSYKPRKMFVNGKVYEEAERYNKGFLLGIHENDNFSLIIQSFKIKLDKLNGCGYMRFKYNYLFVFSSILADEKMIIEATKEMINYQKNFNIKYDNVIVKVPEQIYVCDLNKKRIEIININDNEYDFAMQARNCVIQEELNN